MVKYFFMTVANLFFLVGLANLSGIRVNTTESYPEGVYRLVTNEWQKYDLVESCLPIEIRDFAVEREYLKPDGKCNGHPPVIKKVYGVDGDTIEVKNPLRVNGKVIQEARVQSKDSKGRDLNSLSEDITLSQDEVWLMSLHSELSFDSRYFGAIDKSFVIGKLEAVWLF